QRRARRARVVGGGRRRVVWGRDPRLRTDGGTALVLEPGQLVPFTQQLDVITVAMLARQALPRRLGFRALLSKMVKAALRFGQQSQRLLPLLGPHAAAARHQRHTRSEQERANDEERGR